MADQGPLWVPRGVESRVWQVFLQSVELGSAFTGGRYTKQQAVGYLTDVGASFEVGVFGFLARSSAPRRHPMPLPSPPIRTLTMIRAAPSRPAALALPARRRQAMAAAAAAQQQHPMRWELPQRHALQCQCQCLEHK